MKSPVIRNSCGVVAAEERKELSSILAVEAYKLGNIWNGHLEEHSLPSPLTLSDLSAFSDGMPTSQQSDGSFTVFTARCTLVQSAVLRSRVVCLSVCPSVCDVGEL